MRARLVAVVLMVGALVLPASIAGADSGSGSGTVFRFADRRINESSGLVDLGALMVTTNDSGSASRLYAVDPRTGRTVGTTTYRADTVDVEALAPAGRNAVWVGDIGDNRRVRKSVSVYRVAVGRDRIVQRPVRYRLDYPRGSHDAESLFTDRSGRLHLITKSFTGGVVYRAAKRLSRTRVNRLRPVGRVGELATDAAVMPGGRHLLVRGYGLVGVYTLPGLHRVASFALPRQRQGEGISVGPGGRIRLSSEGVRSRVLQVALPAAVAGRLRTPSTSPSTTPSASPSPPSAGSSPSTTPSASSGESSEPGASDGRSDDPTDDPWLMWSIPAVIVLGAVGIGLGLRRRSE